MSSDVFKNILVLLVIVGIVAFLRSCWRATWGTKQDRLAKAGRCIKCGYDLRASEKRCPECGEPIAAEAKESAFFPLRDEWPAEAIEPRTPRADELPVDVHTAANDLEGDLIVQQLEARGIRSELESRPSLLLRGGESQLIVKVWSRDEQSAKTILRHLLDRKPKDAAVKLQ